MHRSSQDADHPRIRLGTVDESLQLSRRPAAADRDLLYIPGCSAADATLRRRPGLDRYAGTLTTGGPRRREATLLRRSGYRPNLVQTSLPSCCYRGRYASLSADA